VGAQHHYVSKFHLKQFLDPDSLSAKDPWLWQGFLSSGEVKRRSPQNVGTVSQMFGGPGCLLDRDTTLETFLANEVERPAALALREMCQGVAGTIKKLPPALMRYLGWAAARALPMQTLENMWAETGFGRNSGVIEPPPEGLAKAIELKRDVQMLHPTLGSRLFPAKSNWEQAASEGWFPDMHESNNFLEGVHVQAYYFQVRFFPRFKWFTLHSPEGQYFIIADRPVGWAADGYIDAPPSCLRHPSAYILAPLSRNLVLVGRHTTEPWIVTPSSINAVIACWARDWIAGPTQATVQAALETRKLAFASSTSIQ
jgi:hypothetical protein